MTNFPNLSCFLKYQFIKDAIRLLQYQLKLKLKNKHFNTVSMFYYEKLAKEAVQIESEEYFDTRIANNLFYGLGHEYWVNPYTVPKVNLGLRKYKFFSYPLKIIYYAIGLYLVALTQSFLVGYYLKYGNRIYAKYGGYLRFHEKSKELILSYDSVWYKPHYKMFKNRVLNTIEINSNRQVALHLDIQNYFDDLDVSILMNLLADFIEPTVKHNMSFDAIAQGEIESFLSFIQSYKLGIPQSDNDIISSFIGYLYLVFGDLFIEQETEKHLGFVETYHVNRYMDDYYISLIFKENISRFDKEKTVNIISAHIADIFYKRLGLRMNTKTKLYWLDSSDDKEELKKNLKRVSPGYEDDEEDDDDTETPEKKINKIIGQLKKLKNSPLDSNFKLNRDIDTDVFKEIYIETVMALLAKPSNVRRITKVFEGFNFDLVIAQPREIVVILLHSKSAALAFEEYLLNKDRLSSRDAFLILTYLCQTGFISHSLIEKLKEFDQFKPIMDAFEKGGISSEIPGYYQLHENQVLKLAKMGNVIEQIRLRVFAEQKKQYSIALSHLVNEFHSIVWQLDGNGIDQSRYNATHVLDYLTKRVVPHEIRIKIRNLFDRRNKTPIPHADTSAWHVAELEYIDYRNQVGECLKYIL